MRLTPLLIVICCSAAAAQTPKPSPTPDPMAESIRILQEQVNKMERKLAEQQKETDVLVEQEKAIYAARREAQTVPVEPSGDLYFDYYPRYRYSPYRHRSLYLFYPTRRYYPRTYYRRTYISPLRTYRRY